MLARVGAADGDRGVSSARIRFNVVCDAMGALRNELGRELGLLSDAQEDQWAPCWVVVLAAVRRKAGMARSTPEHHPFTQPTATPEDLARDPLSAKAGAYDVVLNGYELGGGSLRIHDRAMQQAVFDALNMGQEAEAKFGFLLDALKLGCPPHGGIAIRSGPAGDADDGHPRDS